MLPLRVGSHGAWARHGCQGGGISAFRRQRTSPMGDQPQTDIGSSAIATYEPPWVLGNDWFGSGLARKFVHHTGIESRPVSLEDDEITLAIRAAKSLQRETGCDLSDCAAVVFASPSF